MWKPRSLVKNSSSATTVRRTINNRQYSSSEEEEEDSEQRAYDPQQDIVDDEIDDNLSEDSVGNNNNGMTPHPPIDSLDPLLNIATLHGEDSAKKRKFDAVESKKKRKKRKEVNKGQVSEQLHQDSKKKQTWLRREDTVSDEFARFLGQSTISRVDGTFLSCFK